MFPRTDCFWIHKILFGSTSFYHNRLYDMFCMQTCNEVIDTFTRPLYLCSGFINVPELVHTYVLAGGFAVSICSPYFVSPVSVHLRRRSGRGLCLVAAVWPLIWAGHHRDPPTEHRPQRRPLLPAVVSGVSINWPDSLVLAHAFDDRSKTKQLGHTIVSEGQMFLLSRFLVWNGSMAM